MSPAIASSSSCRSANPSVHRSLHIQDAERVVASRRWTTIDSPPRYRCRGSARRRRGLAARSSLRSLRPNRRPFATRCSRRPGLVRQTNGRPQPQPIASTTMSKPPSTIRRAPPERPSPAGRAPAGLRQAVAQPGEHLQALVERRALPKGPQRARGPPERSSRADGRRAALAASSASKAATGEGAEDRGAVPRVSGATTAYAEPAIHGPPARRSQSSALARANHVFTQGATRRGAGEAVREDGVGPSGALK